MPPPTELSDRLAQLKSIVIHIIYGVGVSETVPQPPKININNDDENKIIRIKRGGQRCVEWVVRIVRSELRLGGNHRWRGDLIC